LLQYNEQYNILHSVLFTFVNSSKTPLTTVNHSKEVRDNFKMFYAYSNSKYSKYSKLNFKALCLYIAFYKSPNTPNDFVYELNEAKIEDGIGFKKEILDYKRHLVNDFNYLVGNYNTSVTMSIVTKEYIKKNIKWYTFWFYAKKTNNVDNLMENRLTKHLTRKIKTMLLYVNFSEKSLSIIDDLIVDKLNLGEDDIEQW